MEDAKTRSARGRTASRITLGALAASLSALVLALACRGTPEAPEVQIDSSVAKLRATIGKVVEDPQRAALLDQEVDRLASVLGRINAAIRTFSREVRTVNADHGATRAQLDEPFARFEETRIKLRDEYLDVHFALLAQTTPEEWKKLSDHEEKAFRAAGRTDAP